MLSFKSNRNLGVRACVGYVCVCVCVGEREKLYHVKAKHFALWCAQTIYLLLNYSALACDLQKIVPLPIIIMIIASSRLRHSVLPPHRSKPWTIGQPFVEWGVGGVGTRHSTLDTRLSMPFTLTSSHLSRRAIATTFFCHIYRLKNGLHSRLDFHWHWLEVVLVLSGKFFNLLSLYCKNNNFWSFMQLYLQTIEKSL